MTVVSPLSSQVRVFVTFVTVALTTVVFLPITNAASTSYLLNYDRIVSEEIIKGESPSTIAERITKLVASSINIDYKLDADSDVDNPLEMTCLPRKDSGAKCIADYRRPGFSLDVTTSVYALDDDESITKEEEIPLFGLRIDATVGSSAGENARDELVRIVPVIDEGIPTDGEDHTAVWNVRERSMPRAMMQSKKYSVAPTDIGERIFARDKIEEKKLIFSQSEINDNSRIDIWEYKSAETGKLYRDMFLDSTLRATTSDTGIAHAEAFVHPALISHALPKRVAVISDMPVAYVKEILKYKSVTDITLIGANQQAIDAVTSQMPQINDCSTLQNVTDNCMDDERLEIIESDVLTWVENKADECKNVDSWMYCKYIEEEYENCAPYPAYDVVLIDASTPDQIKQWLSVDLYEKQYEFTIFDSILVYNTGSPPTAEGGGNTAEIEKFIDSVQKHENENEYTVLIFVYDEVRTSLLS